jgi:nitrogen fixation/metabolism regulation signal transduction histidine kinase
VTLRERLRALLPTALRRWLRVSRYELRVALALVLAATLPMAGGLLLARGFAEDTVQVWLAPRAVETLEGLPSVYGDLFRARKQLYAEQARGIARGLPRVPAQAGPYLATAVERTPRLRRVAWLGPDGAVRAEAEASGENPEGEFREAPARVPLADGGTLEAVFAIEARYFAALAEAQDLGERTRDVERLRTEITRSYLRAFGSGLFALAVVAAAAGIWLARLTTRRVGVLMGGIRRLARGDLEVQVDPGGSNDEVASLTRAFNAMVREVRESRDRIVYLEKISGWQEVARRLAHEIKNPLTPIQLAFQQLEARWRQGPPAARDPAFGKLLAEASEIVRDEVGTLQRLVAEFSEFAKLPDVKAEPAELGEVAEEFVRTNPQLAQDAEVEVVRAAPDVPVAVDRALFRRVLANLAANAVEAARPERARVHLGVARTRDRAVLTLSDEGPGIDRDVRERIFDPYFTTKQTGTGLGLAIVKKIVLQHGGEIEAGERPGGGASFIIALPLRDAPPSPAA